MKKFLAYILIAILSINSLSVSTTFWNVIWNDRIEVTKDLYFAKSVLKTFSKWENYVIRIDKLIEENKGNVKALEQISTKLDKVLEKEISDKLTKNIIVYLNSKAKLALYTYENTMMVENTMEETISEEDKEFIESKILSLQENMWENSETFFDTFWNKLNEMMSVEEKGNLEMRAKYDIDEIWKFEWSFKFDDYIAKNNLFDYQIKWDLEVDMKTAINEQEDISIKLATMIDYISKSWNIYLLLENLEILEEKNIDMFQNYIEQLKLVAEENNYIKLSEAWTMNILDLENILIDTKELLKKPLITAYKKEENKYYLKPTKHACDQFKKLANKFDPFSPDSCTDNQYQDLLDDMNKDFVVYAEIENDKLNEIRFIWNSSYGEQSELIIKIKNNIIDEVIYSLKENQNTLLVHYIDNQKIDFVLDTNSENFAKIYLTLGTDNSIRTINWDFNFEGYKDKFKWNITYKNDDLLWNFQYTTPSFEHKLQLSGEMNLPKTISNLDIELTSKNLDNNDIEFEWKAFLTGNSIRSSIDFENDWLIIDFVLDWDWDDDYYLEEWEIKLNIDAKEREFNYNTYEYKYKGTFDKIVDLTLKANDWSIFGDTIIYDHGSKIITMKHLGDYELNKLNLENTFELSPSFATDTLNIEENVKWNYNFSYDLRWNNNNTEMFINVLFWEKEVLNFFLENIGSSERKEVDIVEPANSIDFQDFYEKLYK